MRLEREVHVQHEVVRAEPGGVRAAHLRTRALARRACNATASRCSLDSSQPLQWLPPPPRQCPQTLRVPCWRVPPRGGRRTRSAHGTCRATGACRRSTSSCVRRDPTESVSAHPPARDGEGVCRTPPNAPQFGEGSSAPHGRCCLFPTPCEYNSITFNMPVGWSGCNVRRTRTRWYRRGRRRAPSGAEDQVPPVALDDELALVDERQRARARRGGCRVRGRAGRAARQTHARISSPPRRNSLACS